MDTKCASIRRNGPLDGTVFIANSWRMNIHSCPFRASSLYAERIDIHLMFGDAHHMTTDQSVRGKALFCENKDGMNLKPSLTPLLV